MRRVGGLLALRHIGAAAFFGGPRLLERRRNAAPHGSANAHADDGARCVAFKRWLSEQRQTRVATVSHWGTVNNMANREPCIEARGLEREAPPPAWVKAGGWSSRSWPPAVHLLQMPNAGHVAMVFSSESDS